jgi:hypothetical protein
VTGIPQQVGEPFQMAGPVGEDQAVAILAKSLSGYRSGCGRSDLLSSRRA